MDEPIAPQAQTSSRDASPAKPRRRRTSNPALQGPADRAPRAAIIHEDGEVQNAGLDQLLAEAANRQSRFVPGGETVRAGISLVRNGKLARRTGTLALELAGAAVGRSKKIPPRADRRFIDPAWSQSWFYRRVLQGHLAIADWARDLVDGAELEWKDDQRLRLVVDNLIDALSPTNLPLTNPVAAKATIEKGGANFLTGARQAIRDARSPLRLPASVDPTPFSVGGTMANSPGAVVRREPMFELIQYEPRRAEVHPVPVLLVPPMISKFYVVDLSPGKSMVEYLADRQLQPFALSWRNPTKSESEWALDDYIGSIVEAIDTVRDVTSSDVVHLVGFCAGGMACTTAVAHLAQIGAIDRIRSLNLMVTVLDMKRGGPVMGFISPDTAKAASAAVRRKGYLAGTELARTFAWLRPNDMIWNNFVNNYYLGNKPPALDLLFWNLDSMNMPAALHRDMLDIGVNNLLARPGGLSLLGTPLDLAKITCDAYVVGGETDHLTPWPSCYRTTQLFGAKTRFVLSSSGHIAAVIHPPGNPKSTYRIGDESNADPEDWLASAELHRGTWWENWAPWLAERSGELKPAPKELGNARHRPLERAPGTYVFDRSTG